MVFSVSGMNAWFEHPPHLTRGFSHTPRTHSLLHAGE
jgi:hypothetical protein